MANKGCEEEADYPNKCCGNWLGDPFMEAWFCLAVSPGNRPQWFQIKPASRGQAAWSLGGRQQKREWSACIMHPLIAHSRSTPCSSTRCELTTLSHLWLDLRKQLLMPALNVRIQMFYREDVTVTRSPVCSVGRTLHWWTTEEVVVFALMFNYLCIISPFSFRGATQKVPFIIWMRGSGIDVPPIYIRVSTRWWKQLHNTKPQSPKRGGGLGTLWHHRLFLT